MRLFILVLFQFAMIGMAARHYFDVLGFLALGVAGFIFMLLPALGNLFVFFASDEAVLRYSVNYIAHRFIYRQIYTITLIASLVFAYQHSMLWTYMWPLLFGHFGYMLSFYLYSTTVASDKKLMAMMGIKIS